MPPEEESGGGFLPPVGSLGDSPFVGPFDLGGGVVVGFGGGIVVGLGLTYELGLGGIVERGGGVVAVSGNCRASSGFRLW
jgi:hypothetical protein